MLIVRGLDWALGKLAVQYCFAYHMHHELQMSTCAFGKHHQAATIACVDYVRCR